MARGTKTNVPSVTPRHNNPKRLGGSFKRTTPATVSYSIKREK